MDHWAGNGMRSGPMGPGNGAGLQEEIWRIVDRLWTDRGKFWAHWGVLGEIRAWSSFQASWGREWADMQEDRSNVFGEFLRCMSGSWNEWNVYECQLGSWSTGHGLGPIWTEWSKKQGWFVRANCEHCGPAMDLSGHVSGPIGALPL